MCTREWAPIRGTSLVAALRQAHTHVTPDVRRDCPRLSSSRTISLPQCRPFITPTVRCFALFCGLFFRSKCHGGLKMDVITALDSRQFIAIPNTGRICMYCFCLHLVFSRLATSGEIKALLIVFTFVILRYILIDFSSQCSLCHQLGFSEPTTQPKYAN